MNLIPQGHDDKFRPDTLSNSGVVHLKRVPKKLRILLAESLIPKFIDICETPSNIASWCFLLSSLGCFLEKPPEGGKRQRSSLSAIINKRIRDGVIEKRPKRDRKIADFTVDNYAALKLKYPQRETCSVPDPTNIDCFSTSEFFVHKGLMSFPIGSSAGLDGILPQILKDLTANTNGQTGLNFFLKALTYLVNVFLEGKVPFELRPYFFSAKLIALKSLMEDFVLSL